MFQRVFLAAVLVVFGVLPAAAAPITYVAYLSGPAESPPNLSTGTGVAEITIDAATHLMVVNVWFTGLTAGNTAAHIHVINGPGDANTADTLGPVATTTPRFAGFPAGAAGSYFNTLDMTLASSYRPGFITDNGGTTAQAEAALFAAIASGNAYFNIHTSTFPGGEIRGFLQPVPEPATFTLLAFGLAGVGRRYWRQRQAH